MRLVPVPAVRVTEAERDRLKAKAKRAGMTFSQWARQVLLGSRVQPAPPQIARQQYEELARTAANLNQLAHHLNEGAVQGGLMSHADLKQTFDFIRDLDLQLASIRKTLFRSEFVYLFDSPDGPTVFAESLCESPSRMEQILAAVAVRPDGRAALELALEQAE